MFSSRNTHHKEKNIKRIPIEGHAIKHLPGPLQNLQFIKNKESLRCCHIPAGRNLGSHDDKMSWGGGGGRGSVVEH